jgi:tetratricopeptide (TPR) repeat protein
VSSDRHSAESREHCEYRSADVERRMRHLWIPGRRRRLVEECYDIGYASRDIGASDLSQKNFQRAIALMNGRRPGRSQGSLKTFNVVAACHNLLGLQYLDEQRIAEAIAAFDAAIELRLELRRLNPTDRENEVYLGGALCNRGLAGQESNPQQAAEFLERSLAVLRQPNRTCECSYWDDRRQSWWCEQLEALGQALGLQWVALAPQFIDNASEGLRSLGSRESQ